jgi:hypothetical protein
MHLLLLQRQPLPVVENRRRVNNIEKFMGGFVGQCTNLRNIGLVLNNNEAVTSTENAA